MWQSRRSEAIRRRALEFFAAHPNDPRRWDAVAMALMADPDFVRDVDEARHATALLDTAVKAGLASMKAQLAVLQKRGLHATDQNAWVSNAYMLYAQSIEPFDSAARLQLLQALSKGDTQ